MPYEGGLLDQPSSAMRKLEVILMVFNDLEENERKKQEAQAKLK